jgi:tRNA A-37 threonylcarbamoyl transferase component Bud32
VVPGYAGERELGGGASGRVVAAVHVASGTQVAIKYLAPRLFRDPGFLAAFRDEARLLQSLADPHVVRLLDYAEEPGHGAAIVMELVDGVSLHEMITRQGPTGAESALLVLKGSLLGLAAAHALGIVHRDYKPENVLVDADGTSKLTDFGVAVRAGQDAAAGGTPYYMAPEQWDGTPATPAADIYAATAVFFECLTGMTPFSGGLAQLAAQHAAADVPVAMVDEPLRALVARGMAKTPSARPASAAELVTELEAAAAAAYGPDWEDRGRAHLASRAAALLLLLVHGQAAAAGGTGSTTVTTTLTPKAAVASRAGLNSWQLATGFVVIAGVVAGGVIGAGALASNRHPAAAPTRAVAPTTRAAPSARATTPAPSCGTVLSADVDPDPRVVAIARETLTAACNHDATAIDKLLGPTNSVPAVNKILAQPGAYQQIITLLTKTHGANQDGYTIWPGFTLAGTGDPVDAADARALGVTSDQEYIDRKGITVGIGDSYTAKPYIPTLAVSQFGT